MARNVSGTYSLPAGNPVVTGTVIASSWANTTLADLAAEMTDSLDRSGKGGMLAPLLLVDGAAGAPALAFNSEPASGFYRAAANDIGLSVNSVRQFRLTPGGSAPAASFLSPQAAGGTQTDLLLNTSASRTAGKLLDIQNNGTTLLNITNAATVPASSLVLGLGTAAFSVAGTVRTTAADAALTLLGNRNAASTTADVIVNSTATRNAGALLDVQNNATSKLSVMFDGTLFTQGTNTTLALKGNRSAADAGTDITLNTAAARTAGKLLDVQNNGTTVLNIANGASVAASSVVLGLGTVAFSVAGTVSTTASDANLTLKGNRNGGSATADVTLNSSVNRTAGMLLDIQNNSVSKANFDFNGNLTCGTVNGATISGSTVWTKVTKSADQSVTSATPTSLTDLVFNVTSGITYTFRGRLYVNSTSSGTSTVKLNWTSGASVGGWWFVHFQRVTTYDGGTDTTMTTGVTSTGPGNTIAVIEFAGWFTANTSSTMQLQISRITGTDTEAIKKGSYIEWSGL